MSTESELLQRVPDGLFIGGEWRPAEGGRTLDVFDPATGERVKTIADATPADGDIDAVLDVKVVYQQHHDTIDITDVPGLFLPRTGPFELTDYEKVFAAHPEDDIFELRGIDRGGCVVVVRPDQYVAAVLPLDATEELAAFFRQHLKDVR